MQELTKPRYLKGTLAILAGCIVNIIGDKLLGIQLELYWGLQTFNAVWFVDVFVVPLIAGFAVSAIFGIGGKWLCYFPPLIVRIISYYSIANVTGIPEGASLMPMGWWGFFVILTIESAAIGGFLGEIMIKKTYGRKQIHLSDEELNSTSSDQQN